MSDFCTCSQQKTLDLEDEEKKDYEDEEEVLPPTDDTEKAEEELEEPMLDEEEEVSMSIKQALKTLQKSGMTVYSGAKKTPAARRVSATTPVQINWNDFSKSLKDIDNMAERAGGN